MANISEEKWIEMLEKKADGSYIAKYPKVKSKSGVTFDEHLADYATPEKAGHVKAETDNEGNLIIPTPDIPKFNYNATEPPTENDDETKGYSKGSMWFVDTDNTKSGYICINSKADSAVWVYIGAKAGILFYQIGDEYEDITGGWVEGFNGSSGENFDNVFEKHDEYLRLTTKYSHEVRESFSISATTSHKVDFTSIDYLYMDSEGGSSKSNRRLSLSTKQDTSYLNNTVAESVTQGGTRQITKLDVSGVKGEYYIRISAVAVGDDGGLKIYRVWGD